LPPKFKQEQKYQAFINELITKINIKYL
jgi:hypothetical protein